MHTNLTKSGQAQHVSDKKMEKIDDAFFSRL